MLQQTRVETVIPYFERFMQAFPTVCELSQASQDSVLGLWSGLGYYARARNLHRAAEVICQQWDGEMSRSREALESLPGIGRSTAAAILAISYNQPEPILDGNVKRVLSRYCGVEGWPGQSRVMKQLWSHAERLMPQTECGAYTQAIMDLGATLCSRKQPNCSNCPVESSCVAREQGRVEELPQARPGKKLPERTTYMAVLHNRQGEVWMERRPEQGIWGGLWSFPELDSVEQWPVQWSAPQQREKINHTFTHFKLEITPLYGEVGPSAIAMEEGEWVTLAQLEQRGVAAPVSRLVQQMRKEQLI
jgi:A/G-specific adenine glycosylase